jgi:cysteinyl-tRNA synthetase
MALQFYNTASRTVQTFTPREPGQVSLYTCGPTVYDRLHVGNWASYIRWDVLVRVLRTNGYAVTRVMNITDVGHLVSDGDDGQDKLEKGAQREGKTAWDVAKFYTDDFLAGMTALNTIAPDTYARATDYIEQQLSLLRVLKEKGFTYQISDGIYFDTAKFPRYGDFAQLDIKDLKAGARVTFNPQKRNVSDFALWKFTAPDETRDMQWETPADLLETPPANGTNAGFPGWHLECSAIAITTLGSTLDIHTGGIDHIPVHHTNEIAQSEAATGVEFSRFWLHANFLTVDGTKISKSLQNGFTLEDLTTHGYTPLDFRMLVLQSHYRSEANFTRDSLGAAQARLQHWRQGASLRWQARTKPAETTEPSRASIRLLLETINNDIDTPGALELIDTVLTRLEQAAPAAIDTDALTDFFGAVDVLLGLNILNDTPDIDDATRGLIVERQRARDTNQYERSDQIRNDLTACGIGLRDIPGDTIWYRI